MIIKDQKPSLFQQTGCSIWTDPYIGNQMLSEHLNLHSDGASRNRESILKTVAYIEKELLAGSKILDLGCGPGLYAGIFREKGYDVTGIDFNKVSVDYARSQRSDIRYIHGDYKKDYPEGKYDAVMMIYCDMGTHSDDERDGLLTSIYDSLMPGGKLIFDVFTENLVNDKSETRGWEYAPAGGFWSKGEYLLLSQTFHYPENKAFAYQYNLLEKEKHRHFIVWDRYYTEEEIKKIVERKGFVGVKVSHGILSGNNFTSGNEMFICATKPDF